MSGTTRQILRAFLATLLGGLAAAEACAVPAPVQYECPASENLTVEREGSIARVTFAGRSYDLRQKRSSIGDKYISQSAALIIDGDSAVFVAEDQLDIGTCVRALPVASSR